MRRTWALLLAFCLLVLLKSSAKFASIYAADKLGVSPSEGTTLFTTYALASVFSGLFGGFLYDCVPGGKVGIGLLMTSLNLLNLAGFIYALLLEQSTVVSMELLQLFMGIVGFASVLPVSLPFQIYSMAIGGVHHCGMLVAVFEFFAQCVEAVLDLVIGSLLEQKQYTTWLALNVGFAVFGTFFMALFYWLDWRTAPKASVLTAVPSMNFIARQSSKLMLWAESFEAQPSSTNSLPSMGRSPPRARSTGSFDHGGASEPSLHETIAEVPAADAMPRSASESRC